MYLLYMVVAHARVLADRVLHRRWNLRGRRDRFLPPDFGFRPAVGQ